MWGPLFSWHSLITWESGGWDKGEGGRHKPVGGFSVVFLLVWFSRALERVAVCTAGPALPAQIPSDLACRHELACAGHPAHGAHRGCPHGEGERSGDLRSQDTPQHCAAQEGPGAWPGGSAVCGVGGFLQRSSPGGHTASEVHSFLLGVG